MRTLTRHAYSKGFTIVELLIVIVVIAILAAIVTVAYNGVSNQAKESALKSDLQTAMQQIQIIKAQTDAFPSDLSNIKVGSTTLLEYTNNGSSFCLSASSSQLVGKTYYTTEAGAILSGNCPPLYIQTVTTATCPSTRTKVVDARDNHSYWVQKLADGKCWMLTNLGYAGGGTNTYSDAKTLHNGTAESGPNATVATYYIPTNAQVTVDPTQPSTSTDGGATSPQYGYLYNWCAAMGDQGGTAACIDDTTPAPNASISICPSGWRLPTSDAGGEFEHLTTAIGGTDDTPGVTAMLTTFMAQRAGVWTGSFSGQNSFGTYWSSSQYSSNVARMLFIYTNNVTPSNSSFKTDGLSVRCIAA